MRLQIVFYRVGIKFSAVTESHVFAQMENIIGMVGVNFPACGQPGRKTVIFRLADQRVDHVAVNQRSNGLAGNGRVNGRRIAAQILHLMCRPEPVFRQRLPKRTVPRP